MHNSLIFSTLAFSILLGVSLDAAAEAPATARVERVVGTDQPRGTGPALDLAPGSSASYMRQAGGLEFPGEPLLVVDESAVPDETCVPCQREVVSIDLTTRTVSKREAITDDEAEGLIGRAGQGDVHAYQELRDTSDPSSKDFSQLFLVPIPWAGEFPKQVKLRMTWVDTNGVTRSGSCSGTLIDPKHVVTAGHCIYKHDGETSGGTPYTVNDFATTVEVIPAYDDGDMPFGNAWSVSMHTYNGWIDDESWHYDVGVIDLDRPIGALTGWRGYGNQASCSSYYETGTWKHIGYPGEVLDGERMYQQSGTFDDSCGNVIGYDRPVLKGQSGSGGMRDDAIWSVISHRFCVVECGGRDTRFRSFMVNDMTGWLVEDRPTSVDLVAMDVELGSAYEFSGGTLSSFSFLAHNYSQATFTGSVSYEIYLSTDDNITQQDIFLASGGASVNLGPLGSARIEHFNVPVHGNIVEGDYFVGVVITNSDSIASNNDSSGQDAEPLNVSCHTVAVPTLTSPGEGWVCMPTNLTLDWSDGNVSEYGLRVGKTCGGGPYYNTTVSQYTVNNLDPGQEYHWQVRAKTACGSWGYWSDCQTFVTTGAPQPVVATNTPVEDATCQSTALTLSWEPAVLADRYQVQVGTSCGTGNTTTVVGATSYNQRNLQPGQLYHWRVVSGNSCGDWSTWSECREFSTQGTSVALPLQLFPAADQTCIQPDTTLDFRDALNADTYEVQLGTACGQGTISSVSSSSLPVTGLATGVHHWRTRAFACGETGAWTNCQEFTVDAAGPIVVGPITSSTHAVGQWSGANQIVTNWPAGTDDCGIDAYITQFDQNPTTVPTPLFGQETGQLTVTSAPLVDGTNHWFHLAARDIPGTEGAPLHVGPFWIDTTPPEVPAAFTPSIPQGSATTQTSLTMDWIAALDGGSGTVGYSARWSTSSTEDPAPAIVTTVPNFKATGLADGEYWFHLRSVDAVGNWSATHHIGPFFVDTTAPTGEFFRPELGDELEAGDGWELEWNVDADLSGVVQVVVTYSSNNGMDWYPVVTRLPNDPGFPHDPFDWEVPIHSTYDAFLRMELTDAAGNVGVVTSDKFAILSHSVSVPHAPTITESRLGAASPNPFNPRTVIEYSLAAPTHVRLDIFDVQGRHVRTLIDDAQSGPATHHVPWNGTGDDGQTVSSGVYFYRIQAGSLHETRRMTLLK